MTIPNEYNDEDEDINSRLAVVVAECMGEREECIAEHDAEMMARREKSTQDITHITVVSDITISDDLHVLSLFSIGQFVAG